MLTTHQQHLNARALANAYKNSPETLLLALMRVLKTEDLNKLRKAFPDHFNELVNRMHSKDGHLFGDKDYHPGINIPNT